MVVVDLNNEELNQKRVSSSERMIKEADEQKEERLSQITPEDREEANKTNSERLMEKSLSELYSLELLEMKTDLTQDQIISIARGKIFAKRFKSSAMTDLINNIMTLSVSKDRKGRGEMTNVMRATNKDMEFNTPQNPFGDIFRFTQD